METRSEWTLELCMRGMLEMEEAGYELEPVASGMVACDNCGARAWGATYTVRRGNRETEA